MVTVGNYIGMDYLSATASIVASGLIPTLPIEVRIKQSSTQVFGNVIGQIPQSGTSVATGSPVTLTVNRPYGNFPASEQNEPIPYWYFLQR